MDRAKNRPLHEMTNEQFHDWDVTQYIIYSTIGENM